MRAAPGVGVAAGAAGQHGLAAHAAGVDRAEGGGGEGGEHARVRGDRLGDAFASGQAGADELAGVALVHRRAGRADGLAAVAARDGGLAVEGGEFAGGQVDHVGAAAELDRVRAGAVRGELAFPGAGSPRGWSCWCRRRSPQVPSRVSGSGLEGGCRGGHDALAPALLGGLAGDAEPGADLGPGVAEGAQAGDGLADSGVDLVGEAES